MKIQQILNNFDLEEIYLMCEQKNLYQNFDDKYLFIDETGYPVYYNILNYREIN